MAPGHADWVGMMARGEADRSGVGRGLSFVRHNDGNETYLCRLADETANWPISPDTCSQFGPG